MLNAQGSAGISYLAHKADAFLQKKKLYKIIPFHHQDPYEHEHYPMPFYHHQHHIPYHQESFDYHHRVPYHHPSMNYHKQKIFSLEFKDEPEYEPDDTILYQTIKDTKDIKNGIKK